MKRYKVFVSANQKELRKERLTVKETIFSNPALRDFFDVFLFEDLPAKGKFPILTYLKEVRNSDIYIGLLGNQYGVKGNDGLSATEREFRLFTKSKFAKEVLFFIKGKNDIARDVETQNLLEVIRDSYIYKRFTSIGEFKAHVLNSLISFLDDKGILSKGPFDEAVCLEAEYDAIDEREVKNFLENRAVKLRVNIPGIPIKNFLHNTHRDH